MKKRVLLCALSLLMMCGCSPEIKDQPKTPVVKERQVSVFLMGGQSNMEGNTYFQDDDGNDYLRAAFEELGIDDGDCCYEGIKEVKTSYYGGATFYFGGDLIRGRIYIF